VESSAGHVGLDDLDDVYGEYFSKMDRNGAPDLGASLP
jgi:hypothetical protein